MNDCPKAWKALLVWVDLTSVRPCAECVELLCRMHASPIYIIFIISRPSPAIMGNAEDPTSTRPSNLQTWARWATLDCNN